MASRHGSATIVSRTLRGGGVAHDGGDPIDQRRREVPKRRQRW